jgi:predicted acyl esterase
MTEKPRESKSENRKFGNETIEVILRKLKDPKDSKGRFPASIEPGETVVDGIRIERDAAVKMRDGTTIYTDIYRPDGATNLPAIVAYSPYGKRASYAGGAFEGMPVGAIPGVPMGTVSPMAKFEGPDPAYWCKYGYAIINPDARGAGNSEGDVAF